MSRLQKIRDEGGTPDLPEVSCPYLAEVFFEIGPTLQGGMGPAPLTHQEIRAWQENTRVQLTAWEARGLRRLSHAWIAETVRAEDPTAAAPFIADVSGIDRDRVAREIDKFFP